MDSSWPARQAQAGGSGAGEHDAPFPIELAPSLDSSAATDTPTKLYPAKLRQRARQKRKRTLMLVLRTLLSVGLLVLLALKIDLHQFAVTLGAIYPYYAVAGLGVGVVTIVLSAWQWQYLLKREHIEMTLAIATSLYFLGMTFNQLLPSSVGGDVAKAGFVARWTRQGTEVTRATVLARIIGLAALFATSLPVAVVASLVDNDQIWRLALILGGSLLGYVVLLQAIFGLSKRLGATAWVRKLGVTRKLVELTQSMAPGQYRWQTLISATGMSAIFYAASNLNFFCYGLALHVSSPFWFYWVAIPITSLLTMLPISLNGYGIRGASFAFVFAYAHVPASEAISLALLMELQMLVFALFGGLVLVAMNRRSPTVACVGSDYSIGFARQGGNA